MALVIAAPRSTSMSTVCSGTSMGTPAKKPAILFWFKILYHMTVLLFSCDYEEIGRGSIKVAHNYIEAGLLRRLHPKKISLQDYMILISRQPWHL